MNTQKKLVLLGSLYLAQGLPYGFLTGAVPVLLRERGASLTTIGDTSLLMAPWLLKFLWAPWVDRYSSPRLGRRRSWILPLQAATVLTLLGLAAADPEGALPLLMGATFLTAIFASTQDIATDGLAVSLLNDQERGLGNGVQVAGYRLGMVLGGGALLIVFSRLGWQMSFFVMAAIMLLATGPIFLWTEPPDQAAPTPSESIRSLLRRPGMAVWLLLLVLYKLGEQIGGAISRPMLVDLGLDLEQIGWLGAMDSAASLVGALLGGGLVGSLGRRRALVGFGLLQATGVAAWVLPALGWVSLVGLAGVKVYDGFVGSMATAALFTSMMDRSETTSGGTDFTVQASVVLVAAFLGSALGGRIGDLFLHVLADPTTGYAAHFAVSALLTIIGALTIGPWVREPPSDAQPRGASGP